MAEIIINEISQNYTYNTGTSTFATVALPITSMWGPGYYEPAGFVSEGEVDDSQSEIGVMLERTKWLHFPSTQVGMESFVATYKGPTANYRATKDYSYQIAMTLLSAGYDVLVCRVCPGNQAVYPGSIGIQSGMVNLGKLHVKAKYPGSFGNNLKIKLKHMRTYWNMVVYVVDSSGTQSAVENLSFVFEEEHVTDTIPLYSAVESNYIILHDIYIIPNQATDIDTGIVSTNNTQTTLTASTPDSFTSGSDSLAPMSTSEALTEAINLATQRYKRTTTNRDNINIGMGYTSSDYLQALNDLSTAVQAASQPTATTEAKEAVAYVTPAWVNAMVNMEWNYNAAYTVYNLLQDKLNYNPQRIISPGWDDQDICRITNSSDKIKINQVSPLHGKIMETAYFGRCATGLIDIPKSEKRSQVYNESYTAGTTGYAQQLARFATETESKLLEGKDINVPLYVTHSALFAPWGQYRYLGTGKQNEASPSFLALMIQRAQILNQPLQYEWALPTNRRHNLRLGKMEYNVPKHLLDVWQKITGVGINIITEIPDLGLNLWGNSTLFEVPPATYQALANLSTRYLVNAVEDVAYRSGLAITWQYNNEQAYGTFYAGVTPTLDTMKNVGAIDDYYVKMAADINGLEQINANTVVGKIYLVINGVINDIVIDLVALPPGVDLNQFK